jgi:hypothetical protein
LPLVNRSPPPAASVLPRFAAVVASQDSLNLADRCIELAFNFFQRRAISSHHLQMKMSTLLPVGMIDCPYVVGRMFTACGPFAVSSVSKLTRRSTSDSLHCKLVFNSDMWKKVSFCPALAMKPNPLLMIIFAM